MHCTECPSSLQFIEQGFHHRPISHREDLMAEHAATASQD